MGLHFFHQLNIPWSETGRQHESQEPDVVRGVIKKKPKTNVKIHSNDDEMFMIYGESSFVISNCDI